MTTTKTSKQKVYLSICRLYNFPITSIDCLVEAARNEVPNCGGAKTLFDRPSDSELNEQNKLNVLITIDTEVWCNGWHGIDAAFPDAFRKYIYGPTPNGDYGLPFQLKVLRANGLRAVFFVEPLFATRFGIAPLEEIVGLITEAGQAIELHVHTEWVDESLTPILPSVTKKRQHIRYFSYEDQCRLLKQASQLLVNAGADTLHAYRAGSFGANNDTLRALATTNINIDSSFNPTARPCMIKTAEPLRQPAVIDGILEVPMSVFTDGIGRQRPAQLTACSYYEIKAMLNAALRQQWSVFVLLSHSFELLNSAKTRTNSIVVRRFVRLCEYLAANHNRFPTVDFSSPTMIPHVGEAEELYCAAALTLGRLAEQAMSRVR